MSVRVRGRVRPLPRSSIGRGVLHLKHAVLLAKQFKPQLGHAQSPVRDKGGGYRALHSILRFKPQLGHAQSPGVEASVNLRIRLGLGLGLGNAHVLKEMGPNPRVVVSMLGLGRLAQLMKAKPNPNPNPNPNIRLHARSSVDPVMASVTWTSVRVASTLANRRPDVRVASTLAEALPSTR